jgi:hypothetical protein
MQSTRETPETMLCHDVCFLNGIGEQRPAEMGVIRDAAPAEQFG